MRAPAGIYPWAPEERARAMEAARRDAAHEASYLPDDLPAALALAAYQAALEAGAPCKEAYEAMRVQRRRLEREHVDRVLREHWTAVLYPEAPASKGDE